jgi:hypothetical protein
MVNYVTSSASGILGLVIKTNNDNNNNKVGHSFVLKLCTHRKNITILLM